MWFSGIRTGARHDCSGTQSERCRRGTGDSVSCCAEHQSLVHVAETVNLGLGSLEPHLELILDGLEIAEVAGGSVEQRHLAGLLVRRREGLLKACVTVPELVASPLLGLDALLADGLAAGVCAASRHQGGLEVVVLVVAIVIAPA